MNGLDLPLRIALAAEIEQIVPFHDADPIGMAWHGNYFRYFEIARCALLQKIDYGYRRMIETGFIWPIVKSEVKYIRPLPYDSRIVVHARLLEWEYRLKIAYEIRDSTGAKATTGSTVQAAVNIATREMHVGAPEALRQRLAAWIAGLP